MTDEARRTGWSWKVAEEGANAELGLLYEPGTWGDVLKAVWAIPLTRALAKPGAPLRLLDPFAGAATYPLVQATADRLATAPELGIEALLHPHLEAGRFPSTGRTILEAARAAGAEATARVFDVEARRRATWADESGVELLKVSSGVEALAAGGAEADLVLIDPYDLFERRERLLPAAFAACGPAAPLLLYLFNKSPRGAKTHRAYRDMRAQLDVLRGSARSVLVGRIPSDAILPRAFHEVLLVAPPPLCTALAPSLRESTLRLSRHLTDAGAFEDPGVAPANEGASATS